MVKPAAERREEIMDAAIALFAEQGYGETSVQAIAEGAGIAAGTVYLYFPGKEELLQECLRRFHEGLALRIRDLVGPVLARAGRGEPVDLDRTIDQVLEATLAHGLENRALCEICTRHISEAQMLESRRQFVGFLAELFAEGSRAGVLDVADPEMTAYLVDAAIGGTLSTAIALNDPADPERLLRAARPFLRRALGAGR